MLQNVPLARRRKKTLKMIFEIGSTILYTSTSLERFVNTRKEIVFTQTRQSKCVNPGSKWEVFGIAERRIRFVSQA